jgi:5-methylcytosine-specific restriction endonuclease McrBC GTP-binding regulatory subunit McrB
MHRQEPDPGNAAYWFRRVGAHPIFPKLAGAAQNIGLREGPWDPVKFIDICERARREPGSPLERMALETQRAEWQLLFDYCAASRSDI